MVYFRKVCPTCYNHDFTENDDSVRREHQIRTNKQFHYRYPIVFYGAGFHVEPDEYRRFFKPILQNKFAEAAVVRDGARLSVRKERIIHAHLPGDPRRHQVAHLRLYYSKAASAAEFEAFHGYKINQWRSPFIGYQLTSVILDKLRAEFGKLPDMFERAIDAIKAAGYHQKMLCDTIWIPPSQLPTRLESGGKSIPCVLVGDAADAVPTVYDTFSITRVCSEAVLLGEIIAQAWKTEDGQLSNVAQMFYNRACHQWDLYRAFWLKHWDHLHDTPPGSLANPIKITESVGNHAEDPLGQSKYEATSQTRTADPETEEMVRRREQHRRQLHSKIGRDSTKSKPYAYETWKNKGMKAGTGRKSRNEPLQLAFTNTFVCEEEIAKPTRLDKFKPFDEDGLEDESSEP